MTSPDGVRLSYELDGEGPPLLLHLGAGCDSSLWRAAGYVETLSKSYQCILFDHRGHGQSDRPRGARANHIDRYADDVLALLDHLGLDASAFWGYSNGILVGLRVANLHKARISALIGSGGVDDVTHEELVDAVANALASHRQYGWEQMIARFDQQEPDGVPDWMKEMIRATDIEQLDDWLRAVPAWDWYPWRALPQIACPTLFLVGEREDPYDLMAEAASLVPGAFRLRIADQGHINAFLRSDLVLPSVLEFLSANAR